MARSTPLDPSQASTLPPRKPLNFLGPILIMRWPDVLCSLFFLGINYTIWSNQIIATSTLYSSVYHLSEADIGLAYLSTGVGGLLGSVVIGKVMDHDYEAQLRADYPGVEIKGNEQYRVVNVEKARLRSLLYHAPLFLAGILIFGWTVSPHIHIAVSVVVMFAVGWLDCCIFAVYCECICLVGSCDFPDERCTRFPSIQPRCWSTCSKTKPRCPAPAQPSFDACSAPSEPPPYNP